ncbi:LysR family transcriptional regulator [Ramlibacter sp. Leaf400]|uniref:LysR family transcriptional regulator n=1 Tax=Ramlibacter sp. Leaf400 TaxID=1736365 RepID=UPI0006FD526A|nr:LysR family transcriptional regulator [Ramlibacter sp. Leaf400]KQT13924.1 LysR family transcriptional regulator [Ramlibacter sp. Leaf400]
MEFRHLRYFLALSEELHFGRAARRLSISQPPLSLNIRQLEESIGAKLFLRNSKEVRLTAAGRAFVPAARALLEQAAEAGRHAREVEQGFVGVLRVGFVSSMLFRGLPELLQGFQSQHPQLRVLVREMNSENQVVELVHGQLDVAFVHTTRVTREMSRLLFSSEPFVCCLPQGHALARVRKLAVRRLEGEPFVMFSRTASPDYYERVLSICTGAGFHPDVRHEARHWLSVVSLVAQGMGVALVPAALRRSGMPGATFVPIEASDVRSQAFCVWRAADDNAGLQALLETIRSAAEPGVESAPAGR